MYKRGAEEGIVKKYLRLFLFQAAICGAVSLTGMLLRPVWWAHAVLIWALLPVVGAWTAFRAVRKGVNPYVSWILPPVAETFAGLIASMGYAPDAGGVFLTALIALVGGAAGDVVNRRTRRRGK